MKRIKVFVTAGLITLGALLPVSLTQAEETKPEQRRDQAEQRRPNDQRFNPGEFFDRMDQNKDGKLTRDELPERAQSWLKPAFERLKKEALSREDFGKVMAQRFRDRDGQNRPGDRQRDQANRGDGNKERGDRGERGRGDRDGDRERGPRPGDRGRPKGPQRGDQERGGRERSERPPEGFGGPAFFRLLDTNNDHKLSKDELAKAAEKLMELDRNKDGSLDPRELFGGGPAPGMRGRFGPGQGFGPPSERRGEESRGEGRRPQRRPEEGERSRRRPDGPEGRQQGERRRDGERGPGRDGGTRRGPGGPEFLEGLFKRFDKNSDGKLSKKEAPERMKENFSRLDKNSDGEISKSELKEGFAGMHRGGPQGRRGPQDGADAPRRRRPEKDKE